MTLEGQVIIGAWVSLTVTINMQPALGATPFEAVQLTVVVPFRNVLPDAGVQVTVGVGLPVAVAVKVTCVEQAPASAFRVMLLGQVIIGAMNGMQLLSNSAA